MSLIAGVIGFLLGLGTGAQGVRTKLQRKLGTFVSSRGIRLVDREGTEVPLAELIMALR